MNIEKEVRYEVSNETIKKIIDNTTPYKERQHMIDITFGYDGFESLYKYGFICRIRHKNEKQWLEVKKKTNDGWLEQTVNLNSLGDGVNFFKLIGMSPYMFLDRQREVRVFKGLKIFIDEIQILGNYVEVEYQDLSNAYNELNEFLKLNGITGKEQDLYGDIIKDKLKTDSEFSEKYNEAMDKVIKDLYKGE